MMFRTAPFRVVAGLWLTMIFAGNARAQDPTVQRIAGMVFIAVGEYANGFDSRGRLTTPTEYKEAVDFLAEARVAAIRLPSQRQPAMALLDSIISAADKKRPPSELAALEKQFRLAIGSDALVAAPSAPLNPDSGRQVFIANCASCHGPLGKGDGPLAAS